MSTPFILLINPWIYDFAAYDLWIKPLGLLSIAAVLRKKGWGVHLIDCLDIYHPDMVKRTNIKLPPRKEFGQGQFHKEGKVKPDCLRTIRRKYSIYGIVPQILEHELSSIPRPNAVLITSMMTYWYPGVFDCIKIVKSSYPDVPIVLGGVYATLCTEHATDHSNADFVFSGLCNNRLISLLQHITCTSMHVTDDDFRLQPDCSLLSYRKSVPLLSSRGCPMRCPYCASALLYPSFSQKDPSELTDYIEHWHTTEGATDFIFYDDALLVNAEQHIIPLLREVIKRRLPVRFHAPNGLHIRYITHDLSELMIRAGFRTVRLGLETADPQKLLDMGGKVTRQEFIRAATALKDAGFSSHEVGVYILAGLPWQNAHGVHETIRFVQDNRLKPLIAEYSPIPGTVFWNEAVACSPYPIAHEPLFHNNTILPCQWEKFTLNDLDILKREARSNT